MKKISFLLLCALLAIMMTSCENDSIDVHEIGYAKMIFPEPYTTWGGAVSDVMTYMEPYGLASKDVQTGDVALTDGSTKRLHIKYYAGDNPFDDNQSKITYKYYFENLDGGLKAIRVELVQHSQFKLDEITTQFKNSGYNYDGLINSQYYQFSNDDTVIRCYLASHSFAFIKKGDPDELVWN